MRRITCQGLTFVPYIAAADIRERVAALGRQITEEYRGKKPLVICVLNGAFAFAADLFRAIDTDAEIAFIRLSSYQGTASTGQVREMMGLTTEIQGRHVIVVEDIVDTGHTIYGLIEQLNARGVASLKVATLLFKPEALRRPVTPDYVGFEIPRKFIIGYGLDLDGLARNLPDIWILDEADTDNAPAS